MGKEQLVSFPPFKPFIHSNRQRLVFSVRCCLFYERCNIPQVRNRRFHCSHQYKEVAFLWH
jgi:hypothetical protein